MKRLSIGSKGAKALKVLHLAAIALWIGGAVTWLPLIAGSDLTNYQATYTSYLNMRAIAWNVIGWGGIFSFVTGLLNALLTEWHLFKYKWTTVKLAVVVGQIALGMFYIEEKLLKNIVLLENDQVAALHSESFLANHAAIETGILAQLAIWLFLITISIYKQWGVMRASA